MTNSEIVLIICLCIMTFLSTYLSRESERLHRKIAELQRQLLHQQQINYDFLAWFRSQPLDVTTTLEQRT